jgi:hypothetical protein
MGRLAKFCSGNYTNSATTTATATSTQIKVTEMFPDNVSSKYTILPIRHTFY